MKYLLTGIITISFVMLILHLWAKQPCTEVLVNPETGKFIIVECNT